MHLCLCKLSFLSIYFYCLSLSSRSESVSIYLTSSRKTTLFLSSHFPILSLLLFIREKREKKTWLLSRIYSLWLSLSLPLSGYTFSLRTRVRKDHFTFRVKERKRSGSERVSHWLKSKVKAREKRVFREKTEEEREENESHITLRSLTLFPNIFFSWKNVSPSVFRTHISILSLSLCCLLFILIQEWLFHERAF